MFIRMLLLTAVCAWFLAACGLQEGLEPVAPSAIQEDRATTASPATGMAPAVSTATATPSTAREDRLLTPPPSLPPSVAPTVAAPAVTGDVPPELMAALFEDLQQRLAVAADAITVQRAEAVIWPDGSLGCPQPDVVYTQAPVPGYRVTLLALGETYAYHTNRSGYFTLCTMTTPPLVPAPVGTSIR